MTEDNLEEIIKKKNTQVVGKLEEKRLKKIELEKIGGIPEVITEDYIIKSGIYSIDHDIRVENCKLTIEKDTTINFSTDKGIYIGMYSHDNNGQLITQGTSAEPIILQARISSWKGINIIYSKKENNIKHTTIKDAKKEKDGGGIYLTNSILYIENSTIERCKTTNYGGGMYITDSEIKIYNTQIRKNSAKWGGGLYSSNSEINIENTTIKENQARDNQGGGVAAYKSEIRITRSSIRKNSAHRGGGISILDSTVTIDDSTITNNCAEDLLKEGFSIEGYIDKGRGGGIDNDKSLIIQHGINDITNNTPDNISEN